MNCKNLISMFHKGKYVITPLFGFIAFLCVYIFITPKVNIPDLINRKSLGYELVFVGNQIECPNDPNSQPFIDASDQPLTKGMFIWLLKSDKINIGVDFDHINSKSVFKGGYTNVRCDTISDSEGSPIKIISGEKRHLLQIKDMTLCTKTHADNLYVFALERESTPGNNMIDAVGETKSYIRGEIGAPPFIKRSGSDMTPLDSLSIFTKMSLFKLRLMTFALSAFVIIIIAVGSKAIIRVSNNVTGQVPTSAQTSTAAGTSYEQEDNQQIQNRQVDLDKFLEDLLNNVKNVNKHLSIVRKPDFQQKGIIKEIKNEYNKMRTFLDRVLD